MANCSSSALMSARPRSEGICRDAPRPSPTWRSFLPNHLTDTVAIDTFIVATATFRILYILIVLDHHRRKIIHFGMTENPTRVWLSHQITEAFPRDTAPRYLLRDRDASYGPVFHTRVKGDGRRRGRDRAPVALAESVRRTRHRTTRTTIKVRDANPR
jgi:hypothetical protein